MNTCIYTQILIAQVLFSEDVTNKLLETDIFFDELLKEKKKQVSKENIILCFSLKNISLNYNVILFL